MTATEEIARLKQRVETLKLQRARLHERLDTLRAERDRLLVEGRELGLNNPAELDAWVEEKRQSFERHKAEIETTLNAAEGDGNGTP